MQPARRVGGALNGLPLTSGLVGERIIPVTEGFQWMNALDGGPAFVRQPRSGTKVQYQGLAP